MALSSMSDAFLLVNINNKILDSNESAKELFPSVKKLKKFSPIGMIENWPDELLSIGDKADRTSVQFRMDDANYYSARINPVIVNNEQILGYIILIQNITESIMMTKLLEEIAYTDELTGIFNRRHFFTLSEAQLERSRRRNEASYIIMFDIDHFKNVNDTYGHYIGDKVLQSTVERVKGAIRPYDLFARYGGEEFLLLITDIDEINITNSAERIREAICSSPMIFDEGQLTVSASFGVALVLPSNNLKNTIKLADEALYKAKSEGRNRVVHSLGK
jgi:diguanylate cyclase (GGDEF)-like protein